MFTTLTGVVTNGVVVPSSPLPEGAHVEIHVHDALKVPAELQEELAAWQQGSAEALALVERNGRTGVTTGATARLTVAELRKLPRAERQALLAAAAVLAEEDYRSDKELTGYVAFSEEELDGDESDSR